MQNGIAANGINGHDSAHLSNGDSGKLDYQEIPVIDWQLSISNKPLFLAQLREAMISIGFLYLANHPVPPSVIAGAKTFAPKVFDLPQAMKDGELEMHNSPHFHGYLKMESGNINAFRGDGTAPEDADVREQFNFGADRACRWKEGEPEFLKLRGPALWPTEDVLPGFKQAMLTYYEHVEALSYQFTRLVSEALGLAPDALDRFYESDRSMSQPRCKILRYPASPTGKSRSGIAAHVDGSFLTYVLQLTDHRNLEVQNLSGEWIPVPPKEGTFVINLGRMLEKVTRRALPATPHRVLSPTGSTRFSIAFFSSASLDARLAEADFQFPQEVLDMKAARDKKLGYTKEFAFSEKDHQPCGEVVLARKLQSHADVAEQFYPNLFPLYYPDGRPEKPITVMGRKDFK